MENATARLSQVNPRDPSNDVIMRVATWGLLLATAATFISCNWREIKYLVQHRDDDNGRELSRKESMLRKMAPRLVAASWRYRRTLLVEGEREFRVKDLLDLMNYEDLWPANLSDADKENIMHQFEIDFCVSRAITCGLNEPFPSDAVVIASRPQSCPGEFGMEFVCLITSNPFESAWGSHSFAIDSKKYKKWFDNWYSLDCKDATRMTIREAMRALD